MDLTKGASTEATRLLHTLHVRDVVATISTLTLARRQDTKPFFLMSNRFGDRWIYVEPRDRSWLWLLHPKSVVMSQAVRKQFPIHQFHPCFEIFLGEVDNGFLMEVPVRRVFESLNWEFSGRMGRLFDGHPEIDIICSALNGVVERIFSGLKNDRLREKVKTFRRIATENRRSLMQFAAHLIDRAPNVRFIRLTIRKRAEIGVAPVMHEEVREIRKEFVRCIKNRISSHSYLGYSFSLRHDADYGYALDALIFLSEDVLHPVLSVVEEMVAYWNAKIRLCRTECSHVMWTIDGSREELCVNALKMLTLATEPDFYIRVTPPGNARRFWLSQSPIGKLTARTRSRKRSAAAASKRTNASEENNSFLESLGREDGPNEMLQRLGKWEKERERTSQKRSAIHKKGAKTRSNNKKATALGRNESGTHEGGGMPSAGQANPRSNAIDSPVRNVAIKAMDYRHGLRPRPLVSYSQSTLWVGAGSPVQSHASGLFGVLPATTGTLPSPEAAATLRSTAISPEATAATRAELQLPSPAVGGLDRTEGREKVEVRKKRVLIVKRS